MRSHQTSLNAEKEHTGKRLCCKTGFVREPIFSVSAFKTQTTGRSSTTLRLCGKHGQLYCTDTHEKTSLSPLNRTRTEGFEFFSIISDPIKNNIPAPHRCTNGDDGIRQIRWSNTRSHTHAKPHANICSLRPSEPCRFFLTISFSQPAAKSCNVGFRMCACAHVCKSSCSHALCTQSLCVVCVSKYGNWSTRRPSSDPLDDLAFA